MFMSGPSLQDKLVRSTYTIPVCPREYQRRQKTRGRRTECRACDAGLESGHCLWKGIVYCMSCAECGELYTGETERPVRERFAEHFRDAKNMAVRTPWGAHYRHEHHQAFSVTSFKPFVKARIWRLRNPTLSTFDGGNGNKVEEAKC